MKLMVGVITGLAVSGILYKPMHADGFPELGRYSVGIIAVYGAMLLSGVEQARADEFLIQAGAVGFGVAMARLFIAR